MFEAHAIPTQAIEENRLVVVVKCMLFHVRPQKQERVALDLQVDECVTVCSLGYDAI